MVQVGAGCLLMTFFALSHMLVVVLECYSVCSSRMLLCVGGMDLSSMMANMGNFNSASEDGDKPEEEEDSDDEGMLTGCECAR